MEPITMNVHESNKLRPSAVRVKRLMRQMIDQGVKHQETPRPLAALPDWSYENERNTNATD